MALDINKMDYNVLYKTLDEREMYFTEGITYVAKYKHGLATKPTIFIYNFGMDGKIDHVSYGILIERENQSGVEYSIMGWTIDKDLQMLDLGLRRTAKEITSSLETLTPASPLESALLNNEISDFFSNPLEYLRNKTYR